MKTGRSTILPLLPPAFLLACSTAIHAELAVLPEKTMAAVFAGEARPVTVTFHNSAAIPVEMDLRAQICQGSSATIIPLGEPREWKKLTILAGQTVLETISLTFPSVEAATPFLVQWQSPAKKVLGVTSVMVYPTNLLNALPPLLGGKPLGLFDPRNQIKPLLKKLNVDFQDLEDTGIVEFSGKLAIVGPPLPDETTLEALSRRVSALAQSGVAVVWIQSPAPRAPPLEPALYAIPIGRGALTIIQSRALSNLAENPLAQLDLIRAARMALQPNPTWLLHEKP